MNAWGLKMGRNKKILLQSIRHTEFECLQYSSYKNWEILQKDDDRVIPINVYLDCKGSVWGVYDSHNEIILQTIRSTKGKVLEYFVKHADNISGSEPPVQYVKYEIKRMSIKKRKNASSH